MNFLGQKLKWSGYNDRYMFTGEKWCLRSKLLHRQEKQAKNFLAVDVVEKNFTNFQGFDPVTGTTFAVL